MNWKGRSAACCNFAAGENEGIGSTFFDFKPNVEMIQKCPWICVPRSLLKK